MTGLNEGDVKKILEQAYKAAGSVESLLRINNSGRKAKTKMHIAVVDRGGRVVGQKSMDDAWLGSISIAKAKAFTAVAFSSDENALSSRSIGILAQPGQPLWQIGNSNVSEGIIEFVCGAQVFIAAESRAIELCARCPVYKAHYLSNVLPLVDGIGTAVFTGVIVT